MAIYHSKSGTLFLHPFLQLVLLATASAGNKKAASDVLTAL